MKVLKIVFLFIGMIVGAGFATGREIALYFYGYSVITSLISGAIIGLLVGLFLYVGSKGIYRINDNRIMNRTIRAVMNIVVVMSYVIMVSGSETLLIEVTGVKYLGLITGIVVAFISSFTIEKIKNINAVIIPMLIVFIFALGRGETTHIGGKAGIFNAISYASMNMLLGGYLIAEQGEKLSGREILSASVLSGGIFASLLIVLTNAVWNYHGAAMPLFALGVKKGMKFIAAIVIFIAIISTLIGSGKLIFDNTYKHIRSKKICILFLIVVSFISFGIDFTRLVGIIYPIEGAIGILYIVYMAALAVISIIRDRKNRNNNGVISSKPLYEECEDSNIRAVGNE